MEVIQCRLAEGSLFVPIGNDVLYGEVGHGMLVDGSNEDQFFGGDGVESIEGNYGHKIMFSGAGADVLVILINANAAIYDY